MRQGLLKDVVADGVICRCGHSRARHASHPLYRNGRVTITTDARGRCIGHRWVPADGLPNIGCKCTVLTPMKGGLLDLNEGEAA